MNKKNVNVSLKYHSVMDDIKPMLDILDSFGEEDGFDELVSNDIVLHMGNESRKSAKIYMSPETWDFVEHFMRYTICHMIESREVEDTEVYKPIYDQCKKYLEQWQLGTDSFVY